MHRELAALPRPRKHYQWYYSTREANADMHHAPQGVHDFLRAYYHHKSADWKDNQPYPLQSLVRERTGKTADLLRDGSRQEHGRDGRGGNAVGREASPPTRWLPDSELSFYSAEYARTGFQGGLQWYRCGTSAAFTAELETWSGRSIDVPSCFISGKQDWGTYQRPGVFEAMQRRACTRMLGCHLVDGAGHWVQQEQPEQVSRLLLRIPAASAAPKAGARDEGFDPHSRASIDNLELF